MATPILTSADLPGTSLLLYASGRDPGNARRRQACDNLDFFRRDTGWRRKRHGNRVPFGATKVWAFAAPRAYDPAAMAAAIDEFLSTWWMKRRARA